jgi:hypothetical protein
MACQRFLSPVSAAFITLHSSLNSSFLAPSLPSYLHCAWFDIQSSQRPPFDSADFILSISDFLFSAADLPPILIPSSFSEFCLFTHTLLHTPLPLYTLCLLLHIRSTLYILRSPAPRLISSPLLIKVKRLIKASKRRLGSEAKLTSQIRNASLFTRRKKKTSNRQGTGSSRQHG